MEIAPGVWGLTLPNPGGAQATVNAYALRDARGYTLLDCGQGAPECWAILVEKLAELRIPLEAIHTLVATHGHPDHTGAAARLREQVGTQILIQDREPDYMRSRLAEGESHQQAMADWLRRYGFPEDEVVEVIRSVTSRTGWSPFPAPDRALADGDELTLGPYRLRVIWTPGHTPGHVCLYEPSRRWLFCGDHVLPDLAPNVSLQPLSIDDPIRAYTESLRRVADLEVDLGLPGHGDPMTNLAPRIEQLLQHQSNRQSELLAILTSTPRSPYELAGQVWGPGRRRDWATFHSRLRRNAVGTLAAHLEHLAAEGQIARHDDGIVRFYRRS